MSQITRCPACGTTFKVVADQLRISEGWVRCGRCKEVFDAAAHLQSLEPAHLLPEMPLDELRPPPAPPSKASEPARAWGSARHAASSPASPPQTSSPPQQPPSGKEPMAEAGARQGAPATHATEVPPPPVPAFLVAGPRAATANPVPDWGLEPVSPFGWHRREPPASAPASVPVPALPPLEEPLPTLPAPLEAEPGTTGGTPPAPADGAGGYELPFAQLRDSDWPEAAGDEVAPPGADVPLPSLDTDARVAAASQPDKEMSRQEAPGKERAPMALGAGPAVERKKPKVPPAPAAAASGEGVGAAASAAEPGFVRAARRRAFWHSPVVRGLLGLAGLGLLGVLALQVAVQERDRIAALYPGARPLLRAVCTPLHCTLKAPRQISEVVIDSSSFTKGRGDSYQLTLAIKNRAGMAVAMPAVELTLTDAQDQPVLRRVLPPEELSAPAELAARGEWSGTLSLSVAAGFARVAGYRVLAFYP